MLFGETRQATRVFKDFVYQTKKSWSRQRRVVGKAEHLSQGSNPRFVVTSLSAERWDARALYEDLYCARGEVENRIKEQPLCLHPTPLLPPAVRRRGGNWRTPTSPVHAA